VALPLLIILLFLTLAHGVEIYSRHLIVKENRIIAEGDVEGIYGDYIISAQRIEYVPGTKEVFAYGGVELRSKDGRKLIRGSYGYINLVKNRGYSLNAEGKLEKFFVSARRIEQIGKDSYELTEGEITTCPPQKKELKICVNRARFDGKYIYSLGTSLRFFKLPILYLPVVLFPAGDRRSGLLMPMIGSNTYNSFIYRQPLYWAISEDRDLTLTFDLRDKQASGVELEYRQALSLAELINFSLSFYREPTSPGEWWKGRDSTAFRESRYRLKMKFLKGNLRVGLDTASDPFFLEDIYFTQKQRTKPYLLSYLSYTVESELYLASFNLRRYQDMTYGKSRSAYVLPQLGVYFKRKKLRWFYFSLSAEYTHFEGEGELKGHRLKLDPEISLPSRFMSLNSITSLRWINTFYRTDSDAYDDTVNTLMFQHRTFKFKSLRLGRFNLGNILEAVYTFHPKSFNNPRFDRLDVVNKRNDLSIRYKGTLSYGWFYASLFLSGGYNYLGSYKFPTEDKLIFKNWLPIRLITSMSVGGFLTIHQDLIYDPNLSILAKGVSSINFTSDSYSLGVGFINNRDSKGNRINDQLSFVAHFNGKSFFSGMKANYDAKERKFLYRELYMGYRGGCWALSMSFRSTYYGLRKDYVNELYIGIELFDLKKLTIPISRN
jgi:LPS-assembly protein